MSSPTKTKPSIPLTGRKSSYPDSSSTSPARQSTLPFRMTKTLKKEAQNDSETLPNFSHPDQSPPASVKQKNQIFDNVFASKCSYHQNSNQPKPQSPLKFPLFSDLFAAAQPTIAKKASTLSPFTKTLADMPNYYYSQLVVAILEKEKNHTLSQEEKMQWGLETELWDELMIESKIPFFEMNQAKLEQLKKTPLSPLSPRNESRKFRVKSPRSRTKSPQDREESKENATKGRSRFLRAHLENPRLWKRLCNDWKTAQSLECPLFYRSNEGFFDVFIILKTPVTTSSIEKRVYGGVQGLITVVPDTNPITRRKRFRTDKKGKMENKGKDEAKEEPEKLVLDGDWDFERLERPSNPMEEEIGGLAFRAPESDEITFGQDLFKRFKDQELQRRNSSSNVVFEKPRPTPFPVIQNNLASRIPRNFLPQNLFMIEETSRDGITNADSVRDDFRKSGQMILEDPLQKNSNTDFARGDVVDSGQMILEDPLQRNLNTDFAHDDIDEDVEENKDMTPKKQLSKQSFFSTISPGKLVERLGVWWKKD